MASAQGERDALAENRDYLDKYERYTHWQQVNLLEMSIELLGLEVTRQRRETGSRACSIVVVTIGVNN